MCIDLKTKLCRTEKKTMSKGAISITGGKAEAENASFRFGFAPFFSVLESRWFIQTQVQVQTDQTKPVGVPLR